MRARGQSISQAACSASCIGLRNKSLRMSPKVVVSLSLHSKTERVGIVSGRNVPPSAVYIREINLSPRFYSSISSRDINNTSRFFLNWSHSPIYILLLLRILYLFVCFFFFNSLSIIILSIMIFFFKSINSTE